MSLQTERMKLTAEKRKAAEMDNEQRRGEMHTTADVEKGLKTVALNIRSRLLVLPAKLSAKIATMNGTQAEIFDLLKTEIEDALDALSQAEYIVTGDDGAEDVSTNREDTDG